MKWTMKNGDAIEISDMTTNHLTNAMRMIEDNDFVRITAYCSGLYPADVGEEDLMPFYDAMQRFSINDKN